MEAALPRCERAGKQLGSKPKDQEMKSTFAATLWLFLVASPCARTENLSFQGEVVDVDADGSLLVVRGRKGVETPERTFEVNERTTEIFDRVLSELVPGEERPDPKPIAFTDLEPGDNVEIWYKVVRGRNVATLIERNRPRNA